MTAARGGRCVDVAASPLAALRPGAAPAASTKTRSTSVLGPTYTSVGPTYTSVACFARRRRASGRADADPAKEPRSNEGARRGRPHCTFAFDHAFGQNGMSSSDMPSGDASSESGGAATSAGFDAVASRVTAGAPARAGQITPSHDRSRHLKSGAFGLRFVSRLSHMRPPHFGQLGCVPASATAVSIAMSASALSLPVDADRKSTR